MVLSCLIGEKVEESERKLCSIILWLFLKFKSKILFSYLKWIFLKIHRKKLFIIYWKIRNQSNKGGNVTNKPSMVMLYCCNVIPLI